MKILRLFYKKCNSDYACGCGRMVKGICDICGEAYYEATRPWLPLRTKIWLFIVPHFVLYWYTKIKWKIKNRSLERNITLPMVLEAIKLKVMSFYILEDGRLYMVKTVHNDTISGFWQLRKNGKDCNLSDQSEELCKLVVAVLK